MNTRSKRASGSSLASSRRGFQGCARRGGQRRRWADQTGAEIGLDQTACIQRVIDKEAKAAFPGSGLGANGSSAGKEIQHPGALIRSPRMLNRASRTRSQVGRDEVGFGSGQLAAPGAAAGDAHNKTEQSRAAYCAVAPSARGARRLRALAAMYSPEKRRATRRQRG